MTNIENDPTSPRSKSRVWLLLIAGILMFGAAGWLAYPLVLRPDTPVQLASTSFCTPGSVRVYPTTDSGVALFVDSPAPNLVQVDVWDAFHHRRLYQQVTLKGSGAQFAMWGDFMYRYRRIDVTLRNGGTCTVSAEVLSDLNHAHGWK